MLNVVCCRVMVMLEYAESENENRKRDDKHRITPLPGGSPLNMILDINQLLIYEPLI